MTPTQLIGLILVMPVTIMALLGIVDEIYRWDRIDKIFAILVGFFILGLILIFS